MMRFSTFLMSVSLFSLAYTPAAMADGDSCQAEQAQLDGMGKRYAEAYANYEKEGEDLKKDAVNFKFDVTWADQTIIFDTPTTTVRDQKLVLGVPQTAMRDQDIIFHTPSVRMVQVKTGQYPQFTCDHAFIPSCTTTWSNIYVSVPESYMEEQHIRIGIPEFTWADTTVVMGIPEFSMQQQKWTIGLPQFTLKSVVINQQQYQDRADNLKHRVSDTVEQQKTEAAGSTHRLFSCYRIQIQKQRQDAMAKFNQGQATINAVIQSMTAQGADPTKVTGPGGTTTDLVAQGADLIAKRDKALAQFDAALAKLDDSEKNAVGKFAKA